MSTRITWTVVAIVMLSLISLYGAVLLWLFENPVFLPADSFELALLGSQVIRLVVLLSVKRLRRNGIVAIDIFAAEILVIPLLLVAFILGDRTFLPLAGDVLMVWGSAFLLVFPAFGIYKVGAMIRGDAPLAILIPSATSVFAILAFVLSATTQSATGVGLAGMTTLVIAVLTHGAVAAPGVSSAGILLYLGLVVYATMGGRDAPKGRDLLLVFPVLGTASAVIWGLTATRVTMDTFLIFGVPSFALVAILWLGTHAD
ncbi:MAG: hypothetical protein OK474_00625 [Thaumarchaeota archaeon]|nr:hypothetical protein [Nitrososphaerota archaeon]